jgi:hypothetical protein
VDGTVLLEQSLKRLTEDEREIIKQHTSHNTSDIGELLQNALGAAKCKQSLYESQQWSFTFCGQKLTLRNQVAKIVKWLNRFKEVGHVIANADPIHIGLPWAGVCMLLEVCLYFRTASFLHIGLKVLTLNR